MSRTKAFGKAVNLSREYDEVVLVVETLNKNYEYDYAVVFETNYAGADEDVCGKFYGGMIAA